MIDRFKGIYNKQSPCKTCVVSKSCALCICDIYDDWAFTKNVSIEDVPLYLEKLPELSSYRLKKGH